jgi:hypothetical protein
MQLTLEIQNQQELQLILRYLRSLPGVRVVSDPKSKTGANIAEPKPKKDFSKYWGSLRTGLTADEIDDKLRQMRNQWDRDFS